MPRSRPWKGLSDKDLIADLVSALDHTLCFSHAVKRNINQRYSILDLMYEGRVRAGMIGNDIL